MHIKQIAVFLIAILLMSPVPVLANAENIWQEFYVSTSGSDSNPGTKERPFASVHRAQEAVREVNDNMQGDIVVNIGGGTYFLDEMLDFTTEDSGKNGFRIIYRGEEGNMPTISGGRRISGFTPSDEYPGVYQVSVDNVERIAQIYVNGKRRHMAKAATMVTGVKKPEQYDTEQWYNAHPNDVRDDHYNYYDVNTPYSYDGLYMSKEDIGFYENQEDILFLWDDSWKTHVMPVQEILPNPDNSQQVIVKMKEALWNFAVRKNTSMSNYPRANKAFTMMNAMEFLDEPGEIYYNRKTNILYYMPYSDEDMNTAEVIVPVLENLIWMSGNDTDDKVENITFEGLKFAHTAWYAWQEGFIGQQGNAANCTYDMLNTYMWPLAFGTYATTPAAVTIQMTNNVHFQGNYFFGLGSAGLDAANGITNSNITGNAFSDIGDGAFFLGSTVHTDSCIGVDGVSDAPGENSGMVSLTNTLYFKTNASYLSDWDTGFTGLRTLAGGNRALIDAYPEDQYKNWVDEYHYEGAWTSDPNAPARGEKSWVRYDFLRKYSMDKITLAFDPDYVTDEQKTNFEILVSNDKFFAEGNYEVVARQEGPAKELAEYTVPTNEKYQYLMIRTIGATPLALSRVWAFTPDVAPYTKYQRCKNVNFSNNYIDRIGVDIHKATGIFMPYGENITINHNEVTDTGYSGLGLGWSWSYKAYGARNNDFSYNYIHNVTQTMHDGGGLYTLGRLENTTITNNFIDGNGVGARAYYSDEGTAGALYENNAAENMTYSFSPYRSSVRENVYKNNYATHTSMDIYSEEKLNDIETVKTYIAGQPSKEAYAIIENAGLEPEYEQIKDWVLDEENNLYDKLLLYNSSLNDYNARKNSTLAEVNAMIEQGEYGNGLGMFAASDKYKLQNAMLSFNAASSSQTIAKLLELEAVSREVKEGVNRYSMAETLAICKTALAEARVVADGCPCLTSSNKLDAVNTMGMDLASNFDVFKKKVEALEAKASGANTKEAEYEVLVELEKAYNEFMSKRLSADIAYVHVENALDVEIDEASATVKVLMPKGTSLEKSRIEIIPDGSAEIAITMESTIDLNKPYTVPMYCDGNGRYKYWTVSAEYDSGTDGAITKSSNWFTKSNIKNAVKKSADSTILSANPYAYMTDSYVKESSGASVDFAPITPNEINEFTFILGASIYDGLETSSAAEENNRCEVVFSGAEASLYTVTKGTKKLIGTVNTSLLYNEKNNFTYSLKKINDTTQVLIKLNGEIIFSEVFVLQSQGSYFGCHTDKINIKIY